MDYIHGKYFIWIQIILSYFTIIVSGTDQINIEHDLISQHFWIIQFFKNIFDYFIIILPIGGLILLVKYTDLLPSYVKQNKFIKYLVYGITNDAVEDGLPLVVDSDNKLERPKKNVTFLNLLFCFFGLQISFLTWGILQEKIMTQNYSLKNSFISSHAGELSDNLIAIVSTDPADSSTVLVKFQNAQFLVLINRVLAFIIAVIVLSYKQYRNSGVRSTFNHQTRPPFYIYIYCSLSNILSSWCQYEALKFVSFPVQVLSKGFKMIPTMLMNRILMGKNSRNEEWLFALSISFGMTIFLFNEQRESKHNPDSLDYSNVSLFSGLAILILYLTFDSFTSNWQQSLFDKHRSLTSIHMMAAVNLYSILFTLTSLIQQSDFLPAINVLFANPILLRDCIILSICSATGQLFIFRTISTFGAIVFSLIMTLRQAFAILLSCIIYSHHISLFGIIGIAIIFASLFAKSYLKFIEKSNKTKQITKNVLQILIF